MPYYTDEQLREIRVFDRLVRAELAERGLPVDPKPIDAYIASGEFKAAELLVLSKDMVTPGWSKRTGPGSEDLS